MLFIFVCVNMLQYMLLLHTGSYSTTHQTNFTQTVYTGLKNDKRLSDVIAGLKKKWVSETKRKKGFTQFSSKKPSRGKICKQNLSTMYTQLCCTPKHFFLELSVKRMA